MRSLTLKQTLPFIMLAAGIIGVLCAGILMVDKIRLLEHPDAVLGCDINPIVACGSVINTPQASAFGFPNPLIGLVGFGMIAIIGAGMLAGATFRRWFWLCVQGGVTFGIVFVAWLQYQSIYAIGALCPFCMVVWSVMIPLFMYVTLYNLGEGNIKLPKRLQRASTFVRRHHGDILVLWYLVILALIAERFWYYWKTLV
jgi:uncharacterized membrane protein